MNLDGVLPVFLYASAAAYFVLGAVQFGKREVAAVAVGATFVIIGIWILGGTVQTTVISHAAFMLGRTCHFAGTALVPVLLFVCFRRYTGSHTSPTRAVLLLIVPVLTVGISATNSWHELLWRLPDMKPTGEFFMHPVAWGPWFKYLHAPYGYALVGLSLLTLIMHSTAVAPANRRGLFLLAGATIAPMIAIVAFDLGLGPATLPLVPIVFAVMLPIYLWLYIGERITEFAPLAYETVFQNMRDPVVVVDDQRRIIGLNYGAEMLLNLSEADALRASLESVFGADAEEVYLALDTGMPQKMLTSSGRFLHLQVSPIATNQASGSSGRVLMFRDVTDVENAQKEVRSSEKLLRTLIDHSVNGIIRLRWVNDDRAGKMLRCVFANAAAGRYLHTHPEKLVGCSAGELLLMASTGMESREAEGVLGEFLQAAEEGRVVDTEARIDDGGATKWLRVIGEPVGEDVAVTLVDVTDLKAREMHMESIAWSDPLTGVLNRRGFERDAAHRLSESADLATGALLFIDLNDFKQINDRFGHEIGDQLLVIAAERLRKGLRNCDIVGRPGGDEFVALVPDVKARLAERLANRLAESLERPYLIEGKTLRCAASIGLALYPANANTLTGLLRAADQAMYRAKARCRGVSHVRHSDLLEKAG